MLYRKWFTVLSLFVIAALLLSACQPITGPSAGVEPASPAEVFATGALRHSAQGMAFDGDGQLWVTDLIGDSITVVDPASGEIVRRFGNDQGIYSPADLTFAPDGTLYWTDWSTSAVGKIDPDGTVTRVAELPPGANAIVAAEDGRLFVANCNTGDSVINEVYPAGDHTPRLIRGDLGLCAFRYGDWGPDGFFYGARTDLGEIARIDVETGEMTTVATGLGAPGDAKFDSAGRLTTADAVTGEVYRLDPATGKKTTLATLVPGIAALAFDAEDRLYVSNEVEGSIVEVQSDGAIRQVNAGGLIAPGGLAVVGDTVYLADFLAIRGYDRHSGAQTVMIPKIYGASALNDPQTVAADGENLLVSTWFYNSVQSVDPKNGTVLVTYSDFNYPTNAIRFQGDLIVTELGSGSVVRASGDNLAERETLAQGLTEPIGLAATDQDVWVSDTATGAVWQIIADGITLPEPKAVATGLAGPEGLTITPDGTLLVVEAGAGRLSAIDLETGAIDILTEGLQTGQPATGGMPSFFLYSGVAIDADGAIFVSGDKTNVIYRIPLTQPPQVQTTPASAPEIFVQGAPVRLPVGLAIGPDDNLYVSTQWIRHVLVLDPDTGEIIKQYGPEEGVDIPADLAFGPDGSLYAGLYPGFEGDAILRLAPDGKVTGMALPPVIWPVMTTKDGRLFAGLLDQNDMIVELDPDFQLPPRPLLSNGVFIHLREGPDGLIYAIKWFDGEIVRFDPDAPESVETVATGLTLPFNLAFDSKGQLYIIMGVDDATDAVARLDLATGKPEILATIPHLLYGLAIDSKDRIFVSGIDDGAIFEVLMDGNIRMVSPGGMTLPSDVEVIERPNGESLFLADWGAWLEYDTATGELLSSRHGTWWPGTLTNPDTIAPFGDNLLLASSENQQIQIWDPVQQQEVLLIDEPGVDNAIGFAGAIVATSTESKDVVSIDPANPEQSTVLAADLAYPMGLATDGGNLFVGDFISGQILQIAADGARLDPPEVVAEGLQGPEGMALTGDGRLLVVESGANRLSIVDLASGQVSTLIPELGILNDVPRSRPQHFFFNGVDVSSSGMIYVTADEPNVIYRLPLPPK